MSSKITDDSEFKVIEIVQNSVSLKQPIERGMRLGRDLHLTFEQVQTIVDQVIQYFEAPNLFSPNERRVLVHTFEYMTVDQLIGRAMATLRIKK